MIFIGHSLGGLLIKQILHTADSMARFEPRAASLVDRVEKVAFLGTPHSGSDLATWGDWLRILVRPSAATASLVRNDSSLRDLNNWYREWANARGIVHLILTENEPTRILGIIVPPDSADPGLANVRPVAVDTDHTSICKPVDHTKDIYRLIRDFITRQNRPASPAASQKSTVSAAKKITVNINVYMAGQEFSRNDFAKFVTQAVREIEDAE